MRFKIAINRGTKNPPHVKKYRIAAFILLESRESLAFFRVIDITKSSS